MAEPTPMPLAEALRATDARYAKAAKRLLQEPSLLEKATKSLKKLGISTIASYVGAGDNAIVLEPAEDKNMVIRLAFENFTRPSLPQVLQAIHSEKIGALRLEILPRVRTEGVTLEHIRALEKSLAENGYRFSDPKIENIGLLPDNTPVILDQGAIDSKPITRTVNWMRRKKPDNSQWLMEDGTTSKQDTLLPRILFERKNEPIPTITEPTSNDTKWRSSSHLQRNERDLSP